MRYEYNLDKVKGCLVGGAVGGILGSCAKFESAKSIKEHFGPEGITNYSGTAKCISDTQITLFTAVGLLQAGTGLNQKNSVGPSVTTDRYLYCILNSFQDYVLTQENGGRQHRKHNSWLFEIPAMHDYSFYGDSTYAARALFTGSRQQYDGPGGIVRVAPIVLCSDLRERTSPSFRYMLAGEATRLTHSAPIAFIPAAFLCMLLDKITRCEDSINQQELEHFVQECLRELPSIQTDYDRETSGIFSQFKDELHEFEILIGNAVSFSKSQDDDLTNVERLAGDLAGHLNGGQVLSIALYFALRYADSFEKALLATVNAGCQKVSSSLASICGSMMGLIHGYIAIPQRFKEHLNLLPVLEEVAEDLYTGSVHAQDPAAWEKKYSMDDKVRVSAPYLSEKMGQENKHGWVDLGLSVLWATCNVEAWRPEDFGERIAWGKTSGIEVTHQYYYDWEEDTVKLDKYGFDPAGVHDQLARLEASDDVAQRKWGGRWRMPSEEDFIELLANCSFKLVSLDQYGHMKGYLVTSRINGNTILLPTFYKLFDEKAWDRAEGYGEVRDIKEFYVPTCFCYWSSSLNVGNDDCAIGLRLPDFEPNGSEVFQPGSLRWIDRDLNRSLRYLIRPVLEREDVPFKRPKDESPVPVRGIFQIQGGLAEASIPQDVRADAVARPRIVFLTGPGISYETGFTNFLALRDHYAWLDEDNKKGWWKSLKEDKGSLLSSELKAYLHLMRREMQNRVPGPAHQTIANLENDFDVTVITQNIDIFHERAGSSKVIHLFKDWEMITPAHKEEDFVPESVKRIIAEADILVIVGADKNLPYNLKTDPAFIPTHRPGIPKYVIDTHVRDEVQEGFIQLEAESLSDGIRMLVEEIRRGCPLFEAKCHGRYAHLLGKSLPQYALEKLAPYGMDQYLIHYEQYADGDIPWYIEPDGSIFQDIENRLQQQDGNVIADIICPHDGARGLLALDTSLARAQDWYCCRGHEDFKDYLLVCPYCGSVYYTF